MEASRLSKIIFTTKHVETFSATDVRVFKRCFMKELNCESEGQLWCKIMLMIRESLSNDTIDSLKHEAIAINEKNNFRVVKRTSQRNLHFLSALSLARIASFLTKTESLKLGYINRDLYIQTQKRSYLLKRHERYQMVLREGTIFSKLNHVVNNFAYSAPYSLTLYAYCHERSSLMHKWMKSDWFQTLFKSLRKCSIEHSKFLPYVPSRWLFSKHSKKVLDLKLHFGSSRCSETSVIERNVNNFISSYQNYFTNDCQSNLNLIRQIDLLSITRTQPISTEVNSETHPDAQLTATENSYIKPLLLSLSSNYRKLFMENCGMLSFDNLQDLRSLLHDRLKELKIDSRTELIVTTTDNNVSENQGFTPNLKRLYLNLKHEAYERYHRFGYIYERLDRMVKQFDDLKVRQNVTKCTIASCRNKWARGMGNRDSYDRISTVHESLLTRVFFSDNTPLLERMYVQIKNDTSRLGLTSLYFKYFVDKRENIINWNQQNQPTFVCFKLTFENFGDYIIEQANANTGQDDDVSPQLPLSNKEMIIAIDNFLFDAVSFNKIFLSLMDWLRRMRTSRQFANGESVFCRIILTPAVIERMSDYFNFMDVEEPIHAHVFR